MKANEFIKKYGLDEAKRALLITDNCSIGNEYFVSELERLIESHEIIKEMHGLEKDFTDLVWNMSLEKLDQAIADVESCQ